MILVEGEKYACVQCIRGHRSSTCQHTKRPLVQVRSRGRPNIGSDHRVTVFAEQEDKKHETTIPKVTKKHIPSQSCCSNNIIGKKESIQSCCTSARIPSDDSPSSETKLNGSKGSNGSLSAANQPVITLKASKKQLYNVSKGSFALLGPVTASQIQEDLKRHSGKCSCCKRPYNAKAPKNFVRKTQVPESFMKSEEYSSGVLTTPSTNTPESFTSMGAETAYYLQPAPDVDFVKGSTTESTSFSSTSIPYDSNYTKTYSIPRSCCCKAEYCSCENCEVHNVSTVKQSSDGLPAGQATFAHFFGGNSNSVQLSSPDSTKHEHNAAHSLTSPIGSQTSQQVYAPVAQNGISENFDTYASFQMMDSYDSMDDCMCLPEKCECYNCPKHLIVDGIRLSDGVRVASPPYDTPSGTPTFQVDQDPTPVNTQNRTTITNLLFNDLSNEEATDLMEDCMCPADNCNCVNCFKHGIFNNEVVNFETPPLHFVANTERLNGEYNKE